jgi:Pyruvate/2-oxoacid:ferredoxin oxidoreductase delta subunit
MTIFYFTSTGNCLAVAKKFGGNLISIPQVVDSENLHYKDDVIGIVFPIYGFGTPKMVGKFLDKVKIEAEYTFAIGTYGNMPGPAMKNLQKKAEKNGYRFDYANQLLMVDNFLPIFEMDAQRKKLPKKQVEKNLTLILNDVKNRKHKKASAGIIGQILTPIIAKMTVSDDYAKKFSVNGKCNKCRVCAKVCPAKNISVTENVIFGKICEGCLACAHLCPQNAIQLKGQRSEKRWLNPEVSLKEMIEANNRKEN